jgi:hypothetical protein
MLVASIERILGVLELQEAIIELQVKQPGFSCWGVGAAVVITTGVGVGDGCTGVGVGVLRFGVDAGEAKILPTSVQIPCHESTIV